MYTVHMTGDIQNPLKPSLEILSAVQEVDQWILCSFSFDEPQRQEICFAVDVKHAVRAYKCILPESSKNQRQL